ncbi:MAG TPA: hypothetical protein PLT40_10600 [Ilumatobacteraceae bacterium]|nr:hypothetical protein [Ilumatobacteraceae bacterium]
MSTHDNYVTIDVLARLMDDCADSDGQWDGAQLCDELDTIIVHAGGWADCPDHGRYAATRRACPFDHSDDPLIGPAATACNLIAEGDITRAREVIEDADSPALVALTVLERVDFPPEAALQMMLAVMGRPTPPAKEIPVPPMATTHTPRTPDPELLAPSDAELTIAADRASNCMLHGNITDALEIIRDSGAPETVVLLMVMRDSQDGQVSPPNIVLRLLNAMHVQYNQLG